MISRGKDDNPAVKQRRDPACRHLSRDFRWTKNDIDKPVAQHLGKKAAMRLAHIETGRRIVAGEIGNRLGQGVQAQRWRASDPQLGLIAAFQGIGQGADPPLRQNDGVRFFKDSRAKRRRDDPLARADHQLEAQPALHQLHVAGQCRLCQAKGACGAGEGSGADDLVELQQMAGVNRTHATAYQKLIKKVKGITPVYLFSGAGVDSDSVALFCW